ncbi:LuxR C-terminal-related transcriptional regulator [Luteimicrobium sp. DT211]|uniref:LuxR C-terminal-related transcriptional regulator n=1 Tax=Luteimicrobium sp. DT211 TaxID=3393412 RepID=UPI003CEF3847
MARTRLLDLLDDDVAVPITAVTAPAGSGKTSLLATWVARTRLPVAWLSVDESDRDLVQLWAGVLTALETLAAGCGDRASKVLARPRGREAAVPTLLEDLAAVDRPTAVLVLDDVGFVDRVPECVRSLSLFLQGLPPWLHVVATSRRSLPLPVGRLRARGQLREVRYSELRFSESEAVELMHRLAPELNDDTVEHAAVRAGGWAASLRLTALAARTDRAQPGLATPDAGGRLLVADYLWNEILANEPAELVDTLRAVSVVERADAGLAAVLTGRSEAAHDLATAEARGLFVSRVAGTGWFEVHALVREALLADLTERSPDRANELRARAARWLEDHDEVPLALEQWLAAGLAREALRLLASGTAGLYDRGRDAVIARTLDAIPVAVATQDLAAMAEYAWCHLLVDRHRFLALVDELVRWSARVAVEVGPPTVALARVELLACIASTIRGDWEVGRLEARVALARFGPQWWLDPLGRFGWNLVGRGIALSERWDDGDDEVVEVTSAVSLDPDRRIAFEGTRALGEALAGEPLAALEIASSVHPDVRAAGMGILRAELALAEAVAHRELGDRAAAVAALVEIALDRGEATPYIQVLALLELTGAYLDADDVERSRRAFAEAEDLVRTECPRAGARGMLGRAGTALALADRDLDEADRWVAEAQDPYGAGVGAARVLLARGEGADARALLEPLVPRSVRQRVVRELLLARASTGSEDAAKHAIDAVELASSHSLVQTVASEGTDAVRLVELAAWRSPVLWLDRVRRAATPDLDPTAPTSVELVEALTDRERDVLRLLPTRLTMHEIAHELRISANTLKFHLRGIYRKLDCGSRAEAAAVGLALARARHGRSLNRR